jgi:hypothetical protein
MKSFLPILGTPHGDCISTKNRLETPVKCGFQPVQLSRYFPIHLDASHIATDSKSAARKGVGVQVPSAAPLEMKALIHKAFLFWFIILPLLKPTFLLYHTYSLYNYFDLCALNAYNLINEVRK